jgi:putative tricarboxylic transport membrane protein
MTLDTAKADKWTSLVFFALGLAMLIGGFTMDRLEIRQIHPASIPGLVPMILGAAMMLCSLLLFRSARNRSGDDPSDHLANDAPANTGDEPSGTTGPSLSNLGFAALYSIIYAIFLVGSMPFALATAIYIAAFYLHFTWHQGTGNAQAPLNRRLLHLAFGIGFAALSAYAIASLFQYGFLVRLP